MQKGRSLRPVVAPEVGVWEGDGFAKFRLVLEGEGTGKPSSPRLGVAPAVTLHGGGMDSQVGGARIVWIGRTGVDPRGEASALHPVADVLEAWEL